MSIQNTEHNSKRGTEEISFDEIEGPERLHTAVILVLILVFSSLSAFALGRLSVRESTNLRGVVVKQAPIFNATPEEVAPPDAEPSLGQSQTKLLVGSKNSNKYHYPWCSGAKRIKQENLVSFSSFEEARAAGYTPAGNCDGLQ